eukprot:SAG11_NODE_8788_length_976_cov_1.174458_1_plen_102_part_00
MYRLDLADSFTQGRMAGGFDSASLARRKILFRTLDKNNDRLLSPSETKNASAIFASNGSKVRVWDLSGEFAALPRLLKCKLVTENAEQWKESLFSTSLPTS